MGSDLSTATLDRKRTVKGGFQNYQGEFISIPEFYTKQFSHMDRENL